MCRFLLPAAGADRLPPWRGGVALRPSRRSFSLTRAFKTLLRTPNKRPLPCCPQLAGRTSAALLKCLIAAALLGAALAAVEGTVPPQSSG